MYIAALEKWREHTAAFSAIMLAWPGAVSVGCSLVGEARYTGSTPSLQSIPVSYRIVSRYFTDYRIDIHRLPDGPYPAITKYNNSRQAGARLIQISKVQPSCDCEYRQCGDNSGLHYFANARIGVSGL